MKKTVHGPRSTVHKTRILLCMLCCGLWSVVCGLSVFADEAGLFEQAAAKYKAADFKAAAALYQKQIATGSPSAAAYYNLGNSVLRMGQKGMAMVYYERALKADPRDKDARWNIQVLKASLVDRIEDVQTNIILEPVKNVLDHINADELAIAFSVSLALFSLGMMLSVFVPAAKGLFSSLKALALIGLFVSGAFFGWKVWLTKDPLAVVQDKEVIARYGPSDQESKALVLHEGAIGKIIDESGDWVYLQLANKNMGWIRKSSCEII